MSAAPLGVLLMTFGSATTAEGVPDYLRSIRGGRGPGPGDPPDELTLEFEDRFRQIGRSPLIDITVEQGRRLEALLVAEHGAGTHRVEVGMLHSAPRIPDAVARLTDDGVRHIVGIVLAPQYSPMVLAGYGRAVEALRPTLPPGVTLSVAGAWHDIPAFLDSLAERIRAGLALLPPGAGDTAPVILTAHSLPREVVDRDPDYVRQLHATCAAVAQRAGLDEGRWHFAWQSAGHSPGEWLRPDLKELFPELRAQGHEVVLVAPVQFLADHLEILFDVDIAAREEAEEAGLAFHRIELPNASPALVRALAEVVHREAARVPA